MSEKAVSESTQGREGLISSSGVPVPLLGVNISGVVQGPAVEL